MMGMPGNPVSSLVCGLIYLRPAIRAMLGLNPQGITQTAILGEDLRGNDERQDYLRATTTKNSNGECVVSPFEKQDSSMLFNFTRADCLIVRAPHEKPTRAGEFVEIIPLDGETMGI